MEFRNDSTPIFSHTVDLQQEYDSNIRMALVSAKSRITKVN